MAKFIKLTVITAGFATEETIPVYYRIQDIKKIAKEHSDKTTIAIKIEDEKSYLVNVKESPEEILTLIEGSNYSPCNHEIETERLFKEELFNLK